MVKRAKIFLVDDHPIVIWGLTTLINRQPDLTVCGEAADHPRALAGIAATQAELAIVDLSLRHSSGLELLKDLQAQHPSVPVLILSLHREIDYVRRALQAGARGYVHKSEAATTLVNAIQTVRAGRRLAKGSTIDN